MPGEDAKRVCLGRAIGARGLKGEVRIKTFTEDPLAIGAYGPLQNEARTRQFEISPMTTLARIDNDRGHALS